jgi:clan AA aspartic protease
MRGKVVAGREAVVPIVILDLEGQGWEVDAVVDTGSTGELTLPPDAIESLRLPWCRDDLARIGGDQLVPCAVFVAKVIWEGASRPIEVFELDSEPLLGMKLLENHRLKIDIVDGGNVEITSLTAGHGQRTRLHD